MDLLLNSDLVENITKAGKRMKVQGNDSTLAVTHQANVPGYKQDVWFRKDAITNIISLKKLIKQYRVTYDSIDQIFVVHREDQEKPSMEFNMHEYGLNFYNPTNKAVVLINTLSESKQWFSKRRINGAEQAKNLYSKLGYP